MFYSMLTQYQITFAPQRKSYRIGLLFTHKNDRGGTVGGVELTKLLYIVVTICLLIG